MRVTWVDERCILCLGTPHTDDGMTERSDAHVIPRAIGGKLSAFFLCRHCNARMGQFEAVLAQDGSVRLLLDQLEGQIPDKVAKSIRYRQSYFADHPEFGRVMAGVDKAGQLRPRQTAEIKSDENTLRQARAELERVNASAKRNAEFEQEFAAAEPGSWLEVRPGYRIQRQIDWSGADFKPSLDDPITPLHVVTGIAYLYLALCLGGRIYDERFQPIRDALQAALDGDTAAADAYNGGAQIVRKVAPLHVLRAKPAGDATTVTFQLFRDLAWPVRFPGPVNAEQTLYAVDLASGDEHWKSKAPGE
jgi:hypothetical protein